MQFQFTYTNNHTMLNKKLLLTSLALILGLNLFSQELIPECQTDNIIIEDCKVILKHRPDNSFSQEQKKNQSLTTKSNEGSTPTIQFVEDCELICEECISNDTTYLTYSIQSDHTYDISTTVIIQGVEFNIGFSFFNNCPKDIQLQTSSLEGLIIEDNSIHLVYESDTIWSCKICCDQMQFKYFNSGENTVEDISVHEFENYDDQTNISGLNTQCNGSSVNISFNPIPNIEYYKIRYKKYWETDWNYKASTSPYFHIPWIETCENYEFQIMAIGNCYALEWSNIENYYCVPPVTQTPLPGLQVDYSTGIPKVSITPIPGAVQYYIAYRKIYGGAWQIESSPNPSFSILSNHPCNLYGMYNYYIMAVGGCNQFTWSKVNYLQYWGHKYPITPGSTYHVNSHFITNTGASIYLFFRFVMDLNCNINVIYHSYNLNIVGNEIYLNHPVYGPTKLFANICCYQIEFPFNHYQNLQLVNYNVYNLQGNPDGTNITGLEIDSPNGNPTIEFDPIPNVESYKIRLKRVTEENWEQEKMSTEPYFEINNIEACVDYEFQIKAIGDDHNFDWSNIESFDWHSPISPTSLSGFDFHADYGKSYIECNPIPNAESYEIRYKKIGVQSWEIGEISADPYFEFTSTEACDDGESSDYEYQLRCLQIDCDGNSQWSSWTDSHHFEFYCIDPITLNPNPVSDFLYLTTSIPVKLISINDIYGEIYHPMDNLDYHPGSTNRIDVSKLPNGYYYIIFQSLQGIESLRFIKF